MARLWYDSKLAIGRFLAESWFLSMKPRHEISR
jgi:hypothetical protein